MRAEAIPMLYRTAQDHGCMALARPGRQAGLEKDRLTSVKQGFALPC